MELIQKTYDEVGQSHESFVDVYKPCAGWKAKLMFWDAEEGFWDCWQTAYFAFATKEEAVIDAKSWAEAEGIPYVE